MDYYFCKSFIILFIFTTEPISYWQFNLKRKVVYVFISSYTDEINKRFKKYKFPIGKGSIYFKVKCPKTNLEMEEMTQFFQMSFLGLIYQYLLDTGTIYFKVKCPQTNHEIEEMPQFLKGVSGSNYQHLSNYQYLFSGNQSKVIANYSRPDIRPVNILSQFQNNLRIIY